MGRSVKKGPFTDTHLEAKLAVLSTTSEKKVVRTWSRRSTILPEFVGHTVAVHIQVFEPVGRVGDGRFQDLQHHRRNALVGGAQHNPRRVRLLAADEVHHQPRLLRGDPDVSGLRLDYIVGFHALLAMPPAWRSSP